MIEECYPIWLISNVPDSDSTFEKAQFFIVNAISNHGFLQTKFMVSVKKIIKIHWHESRDWISVEENLIKLMRLISGAVRNLPTEGRSLNLSHKYRNFVKMKFDG